MGVGVLGGGVLDSGFLDSGQASSAAGISAAGGVSGCVSTASARSDWWPAKRTVPRQLSVPKMFRPSPRPRPFRAWPGRAQPLRSREPGLTSGRRRRIPQAGPGGRQRPHAAPALASSEENWSVPFSMTVTCESIRSQIRPSLPISRNRQAISRSTRAPLRTGASRCSSARLSSASTANSSAASTELRMAASASVRRSCAAAAAATASAACCAERPSSALEACLPLKGLFPLGVEVLLDPRHRVQHHAGVGIAVALGVFGQEPAAPRSLHEGFGDRGIVLLARQRGAC